MRLARHAAGPGRADGPRLPIYGNRLGSTEIREKINHPNVSGPFETGWGFTDFGGEGFLNKIGLPALPGQTISVKSTTMNPPLQLTLCQKKQAALLYHFASLDYLKGLQQRVNDLIAFVDPTLDLAKVQNRDSVLVDPRWGTRNTSANWANNAWPFLADFQLSIAKNIAERAFEVYRTTGAKQCARGVREYSMQWATPAEEDKFEEMLEEISLYAMRIDNTMDRLFAGRWDDFGFVVAWQEFKGQFPKLPKFRIRADVEGETGKVPVRTGVYISQDDPNGALQFAWTGGGRGKLLECKTFNDIGLDALKAVGRRELWLDDQKMYAFATSAKYISLFEDDVIWDAVPQFDLAPSAVAEEAFTSHPSKWYYVELVNGEFEDIAEEDAKEAKAEHDVYQTQGQRRRTEGGNPCPEAGYYFTPAKEGSRRHFKYGEIMPKIGNAMWQTIWQWDDQQ